MYLRIIILLIASTVFSASTQAITATFPYLPTYSMSFPSLNGSYTYPDQATPVSFDMGVQFSSIAIASIAWTATGTAGSSYFCNSSIGRCFTSPFGPTAAYRFAAEPGFDGQAGRLGLGLASSNDTLWKPDLLLDGKGTLYFGHTYMNSGTVLIEPTFNVSDVTLTVQGTVQVSAQSSVVPLPAALPLLMSGLTGLLFFKRKRKLA